MHLGLRSIKDGSAYVARTEAAGTRSGGKSTELWLRIITLSGERKPGSFCFQVAVAEERAAGDTTKRPWSEYEMIVSTKRSRASPNNKEREDSYFL
jgi:hypothetical protein